MPRNSRTVTRIEKMAKNKRRVFLDGEYAFCLYADELSRFSIEEGAELSERDFTEIKESILLKRARLRAVHILTDMDRTEEQLRRKLIQGGYPEDVAGHAVAYVKSYGYINDYEYARRFVEDKKEKKSRQEIYALLSAKGLKNALIEEVLERYCTPEDTLKAVREAVRKRGYDLEHAAEKDRQRCLAYLARKGFRYEDICLALDISSKTV